jgi:phage repressor protein C with HTH and peptisase S24 domain
MMHDRLRRARIQAGYKSAQAFCDAAGLEGFVYRSHESGRRAFDPEQAAAYAKKLKVPPEWLLYARSAPQWAYVPVVGYVGAGAQVYPLATDEHIDSIEPPPGCPEGAFALVIRGDSMYPSLSDGDMLVCVHYPAEHLLGKRAVVDLSTGERLVKRISPGARPNTYTLLSDNAPPIPDVTITASARILWIAPA